MLNYASMKCTELRQELAKRGAESKGVKAVLVARLQELDAVAELTGNGMDVVRQD